LDFQQIQGGQQMGTSDSDALEERNGCLPGSPADWNCGFKPNEFNLLASLNLLEADPFMCPVPTENLPKRLSRRGELVFRAHRFSREDKIMGGKIGNRQTFGPAGLFSVAGRATLGGSLSDRSNT